MSLPAEVLSALGATALIVPIILLVAKIWFSSEIERSIKLRYDKRFEDHRRQQETIHEAKLQELQNAYTVMNQAFIQGQAIAIERRIEATATLWKEVIHLKNEPSEVVRLLNVLSPDSYDLMRTNPEYRRKLEQMNVDPKIVIDSVFHSNVEEIRPFIGEKCYYMFIFYKGIMWLIPFNLKKDVESDVTVRPWYEHELVKRVLEILLKDDFNEIIKNPSSSISQFSMMMETKFIEEIEKIVSGQLLADEAKDLIREFHKFSSEITTAYEPHDSP